MAEFSYFDQFKTMEIDLTDYLNKIASDNDLSYNQYTFNNRQPIITTLPNLFSKYDIIFDYKNNIDVIDTYEVQDNEFIENASFEIYGDLNFWWVLALFNDIQDPYRDWPLSQEQLVSMANLLYEKEKKFSYQTYLDYLHYDNENKRTIIYPIKQVLRDVIWKYREAILNEQS